MSHARLTGRAGTALHNPDNARYTLGRDALGFADRRFMAYVFNYKNTKARLISFFY